MPTMPTTDGYEVESQTTSFTPTQTTPTSPTNAISNSNPSTTVSANPSLILAFLALSFFTMAMIFIFGFRRYQYLHDRLHGVFGRPGVNPHWQSLEEQRAAEAIKLRRSPGEKPKLWDVSTDARSRCQWEVRRLAGGGSDTFWSWDSIMPLSASKVTNADESGMAPILSRPASSTSPSPAASSNVIRRFWPLRVTTQALTPSPNEKELKSTPSPVSRLRVAVLVAMPSERCPIFDRGSREEKLAWHVRGTHGYELGLYEIPWDDD